MEALTRVEGRLPGVSTVALVTVAVGSGLSGLVFAPRLGLVYFAALPLGIAALRLRRTRAVWRVGFAISMLLFVLGALLALSLAFAVGFDLDDAYSLTDSTLVALALWVLPLLGLVIGAISVTATLGQKNTTRSGAPSSR